MLRTALLSVAIILGTVAPAGAQSVENLFRELDLIGTWSENCAQPPGHQGRNTHTIYAVSAAGAVTLTYDNGPRLVPTVNTILSAERRGDDRIFYLQENQRTKARLEIVLEKTGNAIKVWSSRRTTGEVLVREGKFAADGVESPRQSRCR